MTHDDDDDNSVTNPPKAKIDIHMTEPEKPTPRRIMDEGRAAMTPPAARKDERVVR